MLDIEQTAVYTPSVVFV